MVDVTNYNENFKKFQEEQKNMQSESNFQFSNNYDSSKVMDLSQTNLIKKRPRAEVDKNEVFDLGNNKKQKEETPKKNDKKGE